MTLEEAAAHIDQPVQCRDYRQVRHGVVREVSAKRGLVKVQMHYGTRGGYRLSARFEWWPPQRLTVQPRWADRQATEAAR